MFAFISTKTGSALLSVVLGSIFGAFRANTGLALHQDFANLPTSFVYTAKLVKPDLGRLNRLFGLDLDWSKAVNDDVRQSSVLVDLPEFEDDDFADDDFADDDFADYDVASFPILSGFNGTVVDYLNYIENIDNPRETLQSKGISRVSAIVKFIRGWLSFIFFEILRLDLALWSIVVEVVRLDPFWLREARQLDALERVLDDEHEKELSELKNKLEEREKDVHRLTSEHGDSRKRLDDGQLVARAAKEQEIKKLEESLQKKDTVFEEIATEGNGLLQDLANKKEGNKEGDVQPSNEVGESKKKEEELDKTKESLKAKEDELANVEKENDSLRDGHDKIKATLKTKEEEFENVKRERNDICVRFEEANNAIKATPEEKIAYLTKMHDATFQRYIDKSQQILKLQTENQSLQKDKQTLSNLLQDAGIPPPNAGPGYPPHRASQSNMPSQTPPPYRFVPPRAPMPLDSTHRLRRSITRLRLSCHKAGSSFPSNLTLIALRHRSLHGLKTSKLQIGISATMGLAVIPAVWDIKEVEAMEARLPVGDYSSSGEASRSAV